MFSIGFLSVSGVMSFSTVQADNLDKALIRAYVKNPTLNAQRASLRSTDEDVSRAISGFRPRITATGDASKTETNGTETEPYGYTVSLTQPVFRGLRTINTVRTAEANVLAAREDLRNTEQGIFLNVVTAYMDVFRDQAIVRLRKNNIKVLRKQLRATKDRFDVGEVTRTDVAQAEARLSGAISALSLAQANLSSSRASYQRLVGLKAGYLSFPGNLRRHVPKRLNIALKIASAEHPNLLAAIYREKASYHSINTVRGELLPEVSATASYTERFNVSGTVSETETKTVTGSVTMPIYQAGDVSARIRQSKQTNVQRQRQVDESRAQVKADAIAAWGRWEATKAQLISGKAQVEANRTALNGVRQEEKVGQRTVLDVLDAEQELLDAQVSLSTIRRDFIVAGYSVLSSIGRLSASDIGLAVPIYDEKRYYNKVRNKPFGFGKPYKKELN